MQASAFFVTKTQHKKNFLYRDSQFIEIGFLKFQVLWFATTLQYLDKQVYSPGFEIQQSTIKFKNANWYSFPETHIMNICSQKRVIIKVIYLKGSKWKEIMLRPMLEKYVLEVYVWSPTTSWKYKLLTGTEIPFLSEFSNTFPNKLGKKQLRIYFNIINAVISVEFSTWTQVEIS